MLLSGFDVRFPYGLLRALLTSTRVGTALQKPNLLKHTPAMAEMAQTLNQEREYESDEAICHLISLRQIDDQIQDTLFTTEAAQLSLSDGRTSMHMRFMEAQLDIWKTNLRNVTAQRCTYSSNTSHTMLSLTPPSIRTFFLF